MPNPGSEHTGARIKRARLNAGYTQRELAEHTYLSLGTIRKVEQGERLPTVGTLTAVARALHVTVEDLTGQPYRHRPQDEQVHAPIAGIRAALRHWDLPPDWFDRPRPLHEVRTDVTTALEYRSAGRLSRLGQLLSGLIEELTASVHQHEGRDRRQAARLLSFTYDMAHTLTHRLGYPDLRGQVEDRLRWSAGLADDPLLVALAEYDRVQTFKSAHEYDAGLRIMEMARRRLVEEATTRGPEYITVLGGMRLRDVTLASRLGDPAATKHHISEARKLLEQLPNQDDRRHYRLIFGRGNLAIHEVQASVELAQLEDAEKTIRSTVLPASVTPTRRSAWHVHAARAYVAAGRPKKALEELKEARAAAPQITKYRPMARDAATLLNLQFRHVPEDLQALNSWFGINLSS
ncbi:helix-turn-helix domain-containing protein [Streptomyces hygroscopicus]|uniref:helix-turn-helix domain-containing protein n=1 Tax=Streptomyces hygroscopicus TaxID=1912 RepID=UPI00363A07B1